VKINQTVPEALFEKDFYRNQIGSEKVRNSRLAKHYFQSGWKLGLDPSSKFSTYGYLLLHDDVFVSGANPLVHYARHGISENRTTMSSADFTIENLVDKDSKCFSPALAPLLVSLMAVSGRPVDLKELFRRVHESRLGVPANTTLTSWFDEEYYLRTYPDVAAAGLQPFRHFVATGFVEGRLPSEESEARVKAKELSQSFLESRARSIFGQTRTKDIEASSAKKTTRPAADIQGAISQMKKLLLAGSSETVVAFGHCDFTISVGGIQKAAQYENSFFTSQNINYLWVYPSVELIRMRDSSEEVDLALNLNGTAIKGSFNLSKLITILKQSINSEDVSAVTMHSVYGHNKETLVSIIQKLNPRTLIWFIHDYALKCSSPQLLLNNANFCGDPPLNAPICSLCVHGKDRVRHVEDAQELLGAFAWSVYSPSVAARNVMNQGSNPAEMRIDVLPHGELLESATKTTQAQQNLENRKLRIAFVGHPSPSKGWLEYLALVNSRHSEIFDFFFFGVSEVGDNYERITRVPVRSSVSAEGLRRELARNHIDVVFSWPIWPETFHFVGYEAMEAGLPIISNNFSGNLADSASQQGYLIAYNRFDDLLDDVSLESKIRDFIKQNSGRPALEFRFSGLSPGVFGRSG
jgi:hypothetical protein